MRFADAGRALNQHGLVALNEAARRQIEDLLAIDRGIEREVEPFQRLAQVHGGAAEPELELLLPAPLDLILDEALEEVDV